MYEAYLQNGRYQDILTLVSATEISEGGRNVEETYLYLGHAHLAAGDTVNAKIAYGRALQLNPHFSAAQQALDAQTTQ
jgi:tetratricopeptide (TPR) repeat protein